MPTNTIQNFRFALRNFKGTPVRFFHVESEDLLPQVAQSSKKPSHHIIVIDRSGSMYGDLEALKGTLEKLLTLAEFNDDTQRISLLSYSSSGDVKLHFAKVTVADVMKASSPYLQEIRAIRVTGLTCISQSLAMANTLVDDKETTCISLHTDGYANDRSPSQEGRDIQAAVDLLKKHPALFVNTVAYRDWCDFTLLAGIANQLSGVCIQAKSIKEVYVALHNTQALLAGGTSDALTVAAGAANYTVFYSNSAKKVLGSTADFTVNGLTDADDKHVLRFMEIDERKYNQLALPEADYVHALPYARAMIAEGNINAAKYAIVSSRDQGLLTKHYRALVPTEVAALTTDLETDIFGPEKFATSTTYGLGDSKATVLGVLEVLNTFAGSIRVDIEALTKNYKRRGLKRIAGSRNDDGTLNPAKYQLASKSSKTVAVSGFDINRNTATVNMLVVDPANLVDCATGDVVSEVAGVQLSLVDFKNYTIVGDGTVCTPVLPLTIADKRCRKALVDLGVLAADADPAGVAEIRLDNLPLVDFDATFAVAAADLTKLAQLTALSKILAASVKEASEAYTPEQVAALKEHYLSPALYFSGPTTNDYTDLAEALNTGKVDTRLSYKVELGSVAITNLGKLPSANAFLDRRFLLAVDGKEVAKPKLTEYLNRFRENEEDAVPDVKFAVKALGPKIKLTPVDELMFPIMESFLGLGDGQVVTGLLTAAGATQALDVDFSAIFADCMSRDGALRSFVEARKLVDAAIDDIYNKTISPLVFYVGATGLVPDSFNAKAMNAEQLEAKFPDISLSKDEKEGTFYLLPGDVLLTVYVKGEYFTTTPAVADLRSQAKPVSFASAI